MMRTRWPRMLAAAALVLALTPARAAETAQATRTLTDQTGHVLHLPQRVRSVGTPGISMASLILALGGRGRLAAVTPEVRSNPWLLRIAPEVAALPTPFIRPSGVRIESLLAARPDLVTLWTGNADLSARLERYGIAVLNMSYATPDELKAAALLLGEALDEEAHRRARAFARYYDEALHVVREGLKGLPDDARPRVYYASISPLLTEGGDSMIDAWITAAGGINVAAHAGLRRDAQVQLEQVIAWNPDVIVALGESQRRAILADPRWRTMRAVREGRVLTSPKGINAWCTRAAEAALQVRWAAKIFHPQRFADMDMATETRRFYRQFYGYELDDDEVRRVLRGEDPPAASRAPGQAGDSVK